jgi:hypothetical protein
MKFATSNNRTYDPIMPSQLFDILISSLSYFQKLMTQKPCLWNGSKSPCYLFARKFYPETLDSLLKIFTSYTSVWLQPDSLPSTHGSTTWARSLPPCKNCEVNQYWSLATRIWALRSRLLLQRLRQTCSVHSMGRDVAILIAMILPSVVIYCAFCMFLSVPFTPFYSILASLVPGTLRSFFLSICCYYMIHSFVDTKR